MLSTRLLCSALPSAVLEGLSKEHSTKPEKTPHHQDQQIASGTHEQRGAHASSRRRQNLWVKVSPATSLPFSCSNDNGSESLKHEGQGPSRQTYVTIGVAQRPLQCHQSQQALLDSTPAPPLQTGTTTQLGSPRLTRPDHKSHVQLHSAHQKLVAPLQVENQDHHMT